MIFSKELDESLWLMLESDKNNRKKVSDFLKSVPSELYQQMAIQLDKYREYEVRGIDILERDTICLNGEYLDKDNFKYSFIVDMINHSLSISKSIFRDGEYEELYGLTIYAKSRYNDVNVFGRQMLGRINDYNNNSKCEYDLVDVLFGKVVVSSYKNLFKRYKRLNDSIIPNDITIDDLSVIKGKCRIRKNK